jgi:hypothetical protein
MDRDGARFLLRPWKEVEAVKQRHWVREFARRGHAATFGAAQALWAHMRGVRPDWPTDAERAEDLAHHLELKRRVDQAGRALADR